MVDLLPFLTSLIGLRDPHGKAHSSDVKELCSAFGRKIEMTFAELETLTFAAQIHDIGKIAINEFIINKPGRFTEAEYLMTQHHAQLGANLIETLDLDPLIPLIIRHHHEISMEAAIQRNSKAMRFLLKRESSGLQILMTR